MTIKKQIYYSSQFKTTVIFDLFQNRSTIAEVAMKYRVGISSVCRWKKQLIKNASRIFSIVNEERTLKKIQNDKVVAFYNEAIAFYPCYCASKNRLMKYDIYWSSFRIS